MDKPIGSFGKQVIGFYGFLGAINLAGWAWACWVYEAVVCMRVWESSLSAFLLMLTVWLLLHLDTKSPFVHWISFGVLAGVSALTNTTLLSVFAGVGFWFLVGDS